MKNIIFTNFFKNDFFPPKPASKFLPEWYKKTEEYIGGKKEVYPDGSPSETIKKCIPVFDAMTAGYILTTQVDVQVKKVDGQPYFNWSAQDAISFHPISQAELHPKNNGFPFPKWNNPYSIKTPKGYSCLFIPPIHNPNGIFTVLEGLVDTDEYTAPVNFPFVMNDKDWEGVIPAGTPMVQIIPFKRESWKLNFGAEKDKIEANNVTAKLMTTFHNKYKNKFWARKEYR
jgi:hypothetical protein